VRRPSKAGKNTLPASRRSQCPPPTFRFRRIPFRPIRPRRLICLLLRHRTCLPPSFPLPVKVVRRR